jgi:hypothetical protein
MKKGDELLRVGAVAEAWGQFGNSEIGARKPLEPVTIEN